MKSIIAMIFILVLFSGTAFSAPIQWSISDGGNGHWYEFNPLFMTFYEAKDYAEGKGGYLATITSAPENLWISNTFASDINFFDRCTIFGGNDIQNEGQWEWVTGEDWIYEHWYSGEPNNNAHPGDENSVGFYPYIEPGVGNYWNDVSGTRPFLSSIIEYNSSPVPIPGAVWLLGSGLIGLLGLRRKFKK